MSTSINLSSNTNSRLLNFWHNYIIEGRIPHETNCRVIAKIILDILAGTMGLAARLPATSISRKFGGSHVGYGWTLAVDNTIAYGSLVSWGYIKMIEDSLTLRDPIEKEIIDDSGKNLSIITKMSVAISGIMSQVPFAYMAYKYNHNSIPLGFFVLVADASLPIYSLKLSVEFFMKNFRKRRLEAQEKAVDQIRGDLVSFLQKNQDLLPNLYYNKTKSSLLLESSTQRLPSQSRCLKVTKYAITGLGYMSTAIRLIAYGALGYQAVLDAMGNKPVANQLIGSKNYPFDAITQEQLGFSITTGLFIAVVNARLLNDIVVKSSLKVVDLIANRLQNINQPSFTALMAPRLKFFLDFLVLGLTALCYSTPLQVAQDTFTPDYGISLIVKIGSTYAVLFMVSFSLGVFVDEILQRYIIAKGSSEHRDLILLHQRLKRFIELVKIAPVQDVNAYIEALKVEPKIEHSDFYKGDFHNKIVTWAERLTTTQDKLESFLA